MLISSGILDLPQVLARATTKVSLPSSIVEFKSEKEVFLTIWLRLREATNWTEAGHEVAWHQHRISRPNASQTTPALVLNGLTSSDIQVHRGKSDLTISGLDFSFTFDHTRGYLVSWIASLAPLLELDPSTNAAIAPSFWRAPTDNDMPASFPYWQRFGVDTLTSELRSWDIVPPSGANKSVVIKTHTFLAPPVLAWGWDVHTTYTISSTGSLTVAVHLVPQGSFPTHIPRVGLDLRLPRRLKRARWLGLGPGESYPDKRAAQRVGVWGVGDVAVLHTPYEVPQEGGNRMDTRWVALTAPHGEGVRAKASGRDDWSAGHSGEGEGLFSFAAGRYSARALQEARHPCDLVEEEATLLRLDARVAGVGTGACGPGVREDLLVKTEEMRFGFVLERVGV